MRENRISTFRSLRGRAVGRAQPVEPPCRTLPCTLKPKNKVFFPALCACVRVCKQSCCVTCLPERPASDHSHQLIPVAAAAITWDHAAREARRYPAAARVGWGNVGRPPHSLICIYSAETRVKNGDHQRTPARDCRTGGSGHGRWGAHRSRSPIRSPAFTI